MLPRLSSLFDSQPLSSVIEIISKNEFKRPIYADNAVSTIKSLDSKIFMTIRTTCFEKESQINKKIETI